MPWYDALGGRKYLLAQSTVVAAFGLALASKLTGEFVTIASVAVGAFSIANASTTNTALKMHKEPE